MNPRIETLIPQAIEVIIKTGIADSTLKAPKVFKGYFASFGAAVIQSGLLPAVIFFESDVKEGSNADNKDIRSKLPIAIFQLLDKGESKATNLSTYLIENERYKTPATIDSIMEIATALKIAFRTFKYQD